MSIRILLGHKITMSLPQTQPSRTPISLNTARRRVSSRAPQLRRPLPSFQNKMPDQIKKRKLLGKVSVLVGAILLVAVLFSAIAVAPVAPRVPHAEWTEGALYDDVT